MNAASVLRGLDKQAETESTPIFDRLMAECGSLLLEAPWFPEFMDEAPWDDLPTDYELPPLPIHLAIDRLNRWASSRFDTQMMEVIAHG